MQTIALNIWAAPLFCHWCDTLPTIPPSPTNKCSDKNSHHLHQTGPLPHYCGNGTLRWRKNEHNLFNLFPVTTKKILIYQLMPGRWQFNCPDSSHAHQSESWSKTEVVPSSELHWPQAGSFPASLDHRETFSALQSETWNWGNDRLL